MKRLLASSLVVFLLALPCAAFAQNTNSSTTTASASGGSTTATKRGPVFRATKDQIKQAQTLLKERGLYEGEITGKLDKTTRAGLKEYQKAEGLKATGTLNRVTLEKMSISLTERQREM